MGAADSPSTSVAPPLPLNSKATILLAEEGALKKQTTTVPQSSLSSSINESIEQQPVFIRAIDLSGKSLSSTDAEEAKRMLDRVERTVIVDGDSDLEVETEVPSLESLISWEVLKHLKPKEKKRQEVINGKFDNFFYFFKIFLMHFFERLRNYMHEACNWQI